MKRNLWIVLSTILIAHTALMANSCETRQIVYRPLSQTGPVEFVFWEGGDWIGFSRPVQQLEIESSFGVVFSAACADSRDCLLGLDVDSYDDDGSDDFFAGCHVISSKGVEATFLLDPDSTSCDSYEDTEDTDAPLPSARCQGILTHCHGVGLEKLPADRRRLDNDIFTLRATTSEGGVSEFRYFKYFEYSTSDW